MFFEPRNIVSHFAASLLITKLKTLLQHSSKIEMETISIKVMNKGIFRDEMIGTYEFDMTSVYFKPKHAI